MNKMCAYQSTIDNLLKVLDKYKFKSFIASYFVKSLPLNHILGTTYERIS